MRLSLYTDIGLKVLMYLRGADNLITLSEIAREFDIPKNHLVKVANHLVKLNWISALRGRGGGLSYNISSDRLKLGDIILILEGRHELIDCDAAPCKLSRACNLRQAFNQAIQSFYTSLNKHTMADIASGDTAALIKLIRQV